FWSKNSVNCGVIEQSEGSSDLHHYRQLEPEPAARINRSENGKPAILLLDDSIQIEVIAPGHRGIEPRRLADVTVNEIAVKGDGQRDASRERDLPSPNP